VSDRVKMDYDIITSKVKKIRKLKENFDNEIVDGLTGISNSLVEMWVGDACDAYRDKIKERKKVFNAASKLLTQYADELEGVAKAFKKVDEDLAKEIDKATPKEV
jgi:WXG100 family type VII secretion target